MRLVLQGFCSIPIRLVVVVPSVHSNAVLPVVCLHCVLMFHYSLLQRSPGLPNIHCITVTAWDLVHYVQGLSEKIQTACRKIGVRTIFKSQETLRQRLMKVKTRVPDVKNIPFRHGYTQTLLVPHRFFSYSPPRSQYWQTSAPPNPSPSVLLLPGGSRMLMQRFYSEAHSGWCNVMDISYWHHHLDER